MSALAVVPLVAVLLGLAVVAGTGEVVSARSRAQTAADAAALAAVGAAPLAGGDGRACAAASTAAMRNGATLVECAGPEPGPGAATGWALRAEVTVAVGPQARRGLLVPLRARAAAVLEPVGGPCRPSGAISTASRTAPRSLCPPS